MQKKLTLTIDEEIYDGLHSVIGRGNISSFIEELVKPHVLNQDLDAAYKKMALDEKHEARALEWSENLLEDFTNETL